jgi:hypothetical protein
VTASPAPRTQLPPHLLPILYLGIAHVAFALACLAVALDPRGVSGSFGAALTATRTAVLRRTSTDPVGNPVETGIGPDVQYWPDNFPIER